MYLNDNEAYLKMLDFMLCEFHLNKKKNSLLARRNNLTEQTHGKHTFMRYNEYLSKIPKVHTH